jgi:hypothetical protein
MKRSWLRQTKFSRRSISSSSDAPVQFVNVLTPNESSENRAESARGSWSYGQMRTIDRVRDRGRFTREIGHSSKPRGSREGVTRVLTPPTGGAADRHVGDVGD